MILEPHKVHIRISGTPFLMMRIINTFNIMIIFVVITIVHSFNFILTREIENKMSHVVTVLMFTVSSVDRYIERFIGRHSVDSPSIIG